jgi:hypothetical protein
LLSAICTALDVPLSRVLSDAGTELACREGIGRSPVTGLDVAPAVIPHPAAMAVA